MQNYRRDRNGDGEGHSAGLYNLYESVVVASCDLYLCCLIVTAGHSRRAWFEMSEAIKASPHTWSHKHTQIHIQPAIHPHER